MCFKKEYKCYRGKESEDCCQQRVDEAVAHRTHVIILIISIALVILALTVKTADNTEFVGQVSFASTVTSIVLSVIAIWMSITGERSTNEIKEKVSSSVDKLTDTTKTSIDLSNKLGEMLDEQNSRYEEIKDKMEEVLCDIKGMRSSFDLLSSSFVENDGKSNVTDNYLDEDNIQKMVNNAFLGLNGANGPEMIKRIKSAMNYMYERLEKEDAVPILEVKERLLLENNESESMFILGMLLVFSKNGVFKKVSKGVFGL